MIQRQREVELETGMILEDIYYYIGKLQACALHLCMYGMYVFLRVCISVCACM